MNDDSDHHTLPLSPPAAERGPEIGQRWARVVETGLNRVKGTGVSIPCKGLWTVVHLYTPPTGGDHAVLLSDEGSRRTLSCDVLRRGAVFRRA